MSQILGDSFSHSHAVSTNRQNNMMGPCPFQHQLLHSKHKYLAVQDNKMAKRKKDKQPSAKHYTEN